jgi:formylmethanofuran dehydrogenase subunit C
MKTYVEVFVSSEGEKASVILRMLTEMGLKPAFGEQDFVYHWKKKVVLPEILKFVDDIQTKLKGTGALLKFTSFE